MQFKFDKQIIILLSVMCIFWARAACSETVSVDITYSSSTQPTEQNQLASSLTTCHGSWCQQPTPTIEEEWEMEYSNNIILIPMIDLVVPIQIEEPTLTLKNDEHGRFVFSNGMVRSVTKTKVVTYEHTAGFEYRPTLFVSLIGFNDVGVWQLSMEEKLVNELNYSQYKHYAVEWESDKSMGSQVKDLAGIIEDFLDDRVHKWDVVIVGYSRGGVFAHELSKEIVQYKKVEALHTFLLDPTAGNVWHDRYPSYKYNSSYVSHYASLYYDGEAFIDEHGIWLGTVSDQNISDYTNYGRDNYLFDSAHQYFAEDWVNVESYGLMQALEDIRSKKVAGFFSVDGTSGMEKIKVAAPKGLDIDFDISLQNGEAIVQAEINLEGVSIASYDSTIGRNGVEIYGSTTVSASHAILREDQVAFSQSTLLTNFSSSITEEGLSVNTTLLSSNIGVGLNADGVNIQINLGPVNISSNTSLATILSGGLDGLF